MNMKGIGSVAVLVLVASIVFYKQASTPEPATPSVVDHGTARVVLIADPREAGQSCGCGRIISLVRAVGAGGIAVLEVDPRSGSDLLREHRVVVEPTVIVLDDGGEEVARFEGEDPKTIAAIGLALDELRGAL